MTSTTLEQRGEPGTSAQWVRRSVLVVVCLGLLAAIGAVFTRVIAARVPEQRATLERLITERTGLEVRFDNVRFSWGLDGTSAVFDRVELVDPVANRVRVVAPELRVEFDAWDFLRHQQFSLGHVTLSSPDIEIVSDAEPAQPAAKAVRPVTANRVALRGMDEATLIRRFTHWAELMPIGRIEVEGARVHLLRRGDRAPLHSFTLSQADISRGAHSLNAFGTMLLSQDVGQSLFVSVKLGDLGGAAGTSGELRLIARRVMLDKLGFEVTRGRGTLDARVELRQGRLHAAQWQASARELQLDDGRRFDHFTVNAALRRAQNDLLLDFTDLQITRGATLERSPRFSARVQFAPGSVQIDRVTAESGRVTFMAAQFLSGVFAPQIQPHLAAIPAGWSARAGELRDLRFDSRGSFSATVSGAELVRDADGARITELSTALALEDGGLQLDFDAQQGAKLWMPGAEQPRPLHLAGTLRGESAGGLPQWGFSKFQVSDGNGSLSAEGALTGEGRASSLALEVSNVDRAMLGDAWSLLALDSVFPRLADISAGRIVTGKALLVGRMEDGARHLDWQRSRGTLTLAGFSSAGDNEPQIVLAGGKLDFSRTGVRLTLDSGHIEDLELSAARVEWPRRGEVRLQASLKGDLQSRLLQRLLAEQGLERLQGSVSLDADARGEKALADPALWRVTARVKEGSIPLAAELPAATDLSGTVRYANGELRGISLEGHWLDGPLKIDTRRILKSSTWQANVSGVADAARLLELLDQPEVVDRVDGKLAWSGTLQRLGEPVAVQGDAWQLSLSTNLAGLESRLPAPFDKNRARALNVRADLRIDARGVRQFELESGRDSIRGRVKDGKTLASFDVQGVAGEWAEGGSSERSRLSIDRLELRRAPLVLAAAGALLPRDADLAVQVAELRHAGHDMGGLHAELGRRSSGLEFTLDSAEHSPHELSATGGCSPQTDCRMEFTFDTAQLASLFDVGQLPAEWPTRSLKAAGVLSWRGDIADEDLDTLSGQFDIEASGTETSHQLVASATLAHGQVDLANIQGSGPSPDEVFRGSGRIGLLARTYDLTVDYEQVSLAASAVPSPARAGIARAWTLLRGSAARGGWAEPAPPRRVQWRGSWD